MVRVNWHSYVDLEALASAVKGSLSFTGSQIAFSVPIGSAAAVPATTASRPTSSPPLVIESRILKGIHDRGNRASSYPSRMARRSRGCHTKWIPLTATALAPFRAQATTNLRLALIAVSTDSDRGAYQLLSNLFQNMVKLTDKYVAARANMNFVSPDALQNDGLNQHIVACGHTLGAMAASGHFLDDGSCD